MRGKQQRQGGGLSCVVVNVNGLSDPVKRRTLFKRLLQMLVDVAVLCETHSTSDVQVRGWVQDGAGPGRPWQGHACWTHGAERSRGVAVLLDSKVVQGQPTVSYQGGEGRLLGVTFTGVTGTKWEVLGVYAPVEPPSRDAFFAGPFTAACAAKDPAAMLLVAGDFNCVTSVQDLQVPATQQPAQNSRLQGGPALLQVMQTAALGDVWRVQHPTQQGFTRTTHTNPPGGQPVVTRGRTTRWLVEETVTGQGWGVDCCHLHGELPGDHAAVSLKLTPGDSPLWGSGVWRFPLYLLAVPGYVEATKAMLTAYLATTAGVEPCHRWRGLKLKVKLHTMQYSVQYRRQQGQARQLLQEQVEQCQAAAMAQPEDEGRAVATRAAVTALQQHDEAQLQQEQQSLAALWGTFGEQSTLWFHRLGKEPPSHQAMRQVTQPAGGETADLTTAQGVTRGRQLLADFFDGAQEGGLFHPAAVSGEAQQQLLAAVDAALGEEAQHACAGPVADGRLTAPCVQAALKSSPRGRAPGEDGLPYEFYTVFWEEVGEALVAAFNAPFLSGEEQPQLWEEARLGLIVLIWKGAGKPRDLVDSYRPLTLLNCDVRLVSKVMVLRWGPQLASVIDPGQTAFVPGRWIGDNALAHLGAVEVFETAQLPACLVGLDFAKAYDRVHRGWLQQCMGALGLPQQAMRWVQLLLNGTQAMVHFNGHRSRKFVVPAGCAQGSPLSPLLFVMSVQPLAARCRQLVAQGMVQPAVLPSGKAAPPIHQHADDTTLWTKDVGGAQVLIQQAVQPYCAASGAQVNLPKSWGMTLGSHEQLQGPHEGTGVPFVAAGEAVRHLGVPLVKGDAQPAVERVFQGKLQAARAKVLRWARFGLGLQGRAHVCKQEVASVVSYHAGLLPMPPACMKKLQTLIKGFVLGNKLLAEEEVTLRGSARPSIAVMSLPKEQGGISLVDVEAFVTALQAKVAARALHPAPALWKDMLAWAVRRAFPQQGMRVLLHPPTAGGRVPAITARVAGYVRALGRMPIVRGVPHAQMTAAQVKLEGLVGNPSVADPNGRQYTAHSALPAALRTRRCLGEVPQPDLQLLKLPAAWPAALGAEQVSEWEVEEGAGLVRRRVGQEWEVFRIGAQQELTPLEGPAPDGLPGPWLPACVVAMPHQLLPQVTVRYLCGPFSSLEVDPSVWMVGDVPLLQYTVREATKALIMLQCRDTPGWLLGRGVRPKLWGLPVEGQVQEGWDAGGPPMPLAVSGLHERHVQRFEQAQAAAGSSRRGVTRVREEDLGSQLYGASWMEPSPARNHPLQRVAEAGAAITALREQQRQQQEAIVGPEVDDTVWNEAPPAAWGGVWQRAHHRRLSRPIQAFAWRLLHGALPTGGDAIRFVAAGSQDLQGCLCAAPCCQNLAPRPLESLWHLFLQCGVGKNALRWLVALWAHIDPQAPEVPLVATVLLADNKAEWRPSNGLGGLWTVLRVTMLHSIWAVRCAAKHQQGVFSRQAVVAVFVREVRGMLLGDWARVQGDIRLMAGVPPSWFRGRDPSMALQAFKQAWAVHTGVLATVGEAPGEPATMTLQLQITSAGGQYFVQEGG